MTALEWDPPEPADAPPEGWTLDKQRRLRWLEREHGETQEMLQRVLSLCDCHAEHDTIAVEVQPFVRPF